MGSRSTGVADGQGSPPSLEQLKEHGPGHSAFDGSESEVDGYGNWVFEDYGLALWWQLEHRCPVQPARCGQICLPSTGHLMAPWLRSLSTSM